MIFKRKQTVDIDQDRKARYFLHIINLYESEKLKNIKNIEQLNSQPDFDWKYFFEFYLNTDRKIIKKNIKKDE